jgi:hypothetical protein
MFRLEEDRAVINRYGFNSDGAAAGITPVWQRDRRAGSVCALSNHTRAFRGAPLIPTRPLPFY